MNRSAEQTNRPRTASQFTRFVCPALRFIPHEPRKKDTHSLNEHTSPIVIWRFYINQPWIVVSAWTCWNYFTLLETEMSPSLEFVKTT